MSRFISRGFAHPAIAGHVRRAGIVIAAAAAFTLCLALPSSADGWVCQSNTESGPTSTSTSSSEGETATYTAVYVWRSSTGAPAPQTAYFKVVSGAGWSGGWEGQEPSWTADDGFGDQPASLIYALGGGNYCGSGYSSTGGGRLIQESGASGAITISVSPSVSVATAGLTRISQMSMDCTISPDTRGLDWSSELDPTYGYYADGGLMANPSPANRLFVDTLASYYPGNNDWTGTVDVLGLTADPIGFTPAFIDWTSTPSSGATELQSTTYNDSNSIEWDCSGSPSLQFPVLTALTLTAVDPTDGAKATADGVIAWHLPEEDFVRAGSISQGVDILTGKVDLAPGTCYTFEIPSAEASVSDEYAGGLFLAAAGSLLPLTDLTELGVCIGQSIAGAVSYALGSYQPTPPPPVSVYADADYTQFCNDINYEVQMLDAGENAYPRFTPPSEAPTIQAQLQSNPDNANQDPYFQDASAVVCAGRNFTAYPIRGKLYNVHGFTGYVDEWVTIQKQAYFTWFDWSSTYNEGNQ